MVKTTEKSLKEQYIENQKNAFFREVQEDVQAEKVYKIWFKYKKYIISVIAIILAITIAKNWFIAYKNKTNLDNAKKFEQIISNEKLSTDEKISALKEFSNKAKFGYKDIAYFNIYSIQMDNKKYDDAISTLEFIIHKSNNDTFKNLATIKLGTMLETIPQKDYLKIKEKLTDIGSSKPLSPVAKFVLGTIYIKENNLDSASKIFNEISDDINLPVSIKSQSLSLLNYIKSLRIK